MNLWRWLRGHDLSEPPIPPADPQTDDGPLIPDDEPERTRSTSERKARGQRARIQREEIEGALDRLARNAAKQWAESGINETAKREEAWRLVSVIRALRTELRSVEADGEMAAAAELHRAKRPADNRD